MQRYQDSERGRNKERGILRVCVCEREIYTDRERERERERQRERERERERADAAAFAAATAAAFDAIFADDVDERKKYKEIDRERQSS